MTNLENWTGKVSDLTNKDLFKLKKITYSLLLDENVIMPRNILKDNLDILCEIERELTLRRK